MFIEIFNENFKQAQDVVERLQGDRKYVRKRSLPVFFIYTYYIKFSLFLLMVMYDHI